jgi:hypothetical protein
MSVPVTYAGETVQVWFQSKSPDLSAGTAVEVTIEDCIPQMSDDTWIDTTSFTSKLVGENGTYGFDCPTTVDFKPGMWHVKSISYGAKKVKPVELLQGRDFNGLPFYIVNARKPSTQEGTIQFDGIKSVGK